jgi:hypothetical protein
MYKDLAIDDTVIDGDEVLNEFAPYDYTTVHDYVGKKVFNCRGYITNNQRVFRRPLKTAEGSEAAKRIRQMLAEPEHQQKE